MSDLENYNEIDLSVYKGGGQILKLKEPINHTKKKGLNKGKRTRKIMKGSGTSEDARRYLDMINKKKSVVDVNDIIQLKEYIIIAIESKSTQKYVSKTTIERLNKVIEDFINLNVETSLKKTHNEFIQDIQDEIKSSIEKKKKQETRLKEGMNKLKEGIKNKYNELRKGNEQYEDSNIISLIENIDKKTLKLCVRTIHLPGLGFAQQMGSKHKVLEVYEMDDNGLDPKKLLFSVGGKLRIDAERHNGKLEIYGSDDDVDYYMEFPDQFLECDVKYNEIQEEGKEKRKEEGKEDRKPKNLFIDTFTTFDVYKEALGKINKGHHIRDLIGEQIAKVLYKVDKEQKIKQSEFEILRIDSKEAKLFIKKLLFILLIDRNRTSTSNIRGNFVDFDEGRVILEFEERGVYGYYDRPNNFNYYSEYNNENFFVDLLIDKGNLNDDNMKKLYERYKERITYYIYNHFGTEQQEANTLFIAFNNCFPNDEIPKITIADINTTDANKRIFVNSLERKIHDKEPTDEKKSEIVTAIKSDMSDESENGIIAKESITTILGKIADKIIAENAKLKAEIKTEQEKRTERTKMKAKFTKSEDATKSRVAPKGKGPMKLNETMYDDKIEKVKMYLNKEKNIKNREETAKILSLINQQIKANPQIYDNIKSAELENEIGQLISESVTEAVPYRASGTNNTEITQETKYKEVANYLSTFSVGLGEMLNSINIDLPSFYGILKTKIITKYFKLDKDRETYKQYTIIDIIETLKRIKNIINEEFTA